MGETMGHQKQLNPRLLRRYISTAIRNSPVIANHRQVRLGFAESHMKWGKRWPRLVITDEKKSL